MDEAIIIFSRNGIFTTTVSARDVHSREHARKLWPLVTPYQPRQLLTWVKPTFDENGKRLRRSHFRTLPGARNVDIRQFFEQEETVRYRASQESPEHSLAKKLIAEALRKRLQEHRAMPWFFHDPSASDFHLSGNLLLGAEDVRIEELVKTSFGCDYRLDLAIASKPINKGPILLGGIEIEWGHQFDGRKALIGKSQAFPLISIDITGMALDEITPEWADRALTATTRSSENGQRKTYVYLHDLLYPLYLQLPGGLIKDRSHQFLVFAQDDELRKLMGWIKKLSEKLDIPGSAMSVSLVNAKSEQSRKMLVNAGDIVGPDWASVNDHQCLRLTVERPSPVDVAAHLFHLGVANLLLSFSDSLVGYKHRTGILNDESEEDLWTHSQWDDSKKKFNRYRVLPKRLAEPRSRIVNVLNSLGQATL